MNKRDIQASLGQVYQAKQQWAKAQTQFTNEVDRTMKRLIHEAAREMMSVEEVAKASGLTVKRVRTLMREAGLNPHSGRALLSAQAAKVLADNADALGIAPNQMDLTSPLAYLPMGTALRAQLADASAPRVTELKPGGER